MRVVEVTRFGGPEVLVARDAPDPIPGPGQAIVDIAVADTLFVETQIRTGWGGDVFKFTPPYVPGFGAAGHVRAVGEGVDPTWVGRPVVARTGRRGGSYAEQAVLAADDLVAIPDGLGLREAAALMSDGPTALAVAEAARLRSGQWVLVVAAAGGMGILLVQLAHAAGARVIGVARGARKLAFVRRAGADETLDYAEEGWAARVRAATGGRGVDVVFDGAGGELGRAAFSVTANGGHFSAHGASSGGFTAIEPDDAIAREIAVRGIADVQFARADIKRMTARALALAASGRIRPVIGKTFPLERAADAHAAIEARAVIGKTLLVIDEANVA